MMVDVFVIILAAVLNILWGIAFVKTLKAAWEFVKELAGAEVKGVGKHAKH